MLKRILDVTTSLATIAVAITLLLMLFVSPGDKRSWPWKARVQKPPTGYVRGEQMPALPGVEYRAFTRTLLVVYRSRCAFCIQSIPYYQRLTALRDKTRARVQVVGVAFEQDADARVFPEQQGWRPDRLVFVQPSTIKVRGAPSVLLLDTNGTVIESWLGETTADSYEDIAKTTFR